MARDRAGERDRVSRPSVRIEPDEIVLRDESFVLFKVTNDHAPAILRRLSALPSPFQMVVRELDKTTFLLADADLLEVGDLARTRVAELVPYRVLTFTPALPWTLVGFLARVTTLLAEHEIPLGAIAAYDQDHLFVRFDLAERAHAILVGAARDGRLP